MKPILLAFFLSLALILNAQTNAKRVESSIERVTVFQQKAQVIRSANTALPQGKSDIVFTGLSPYLDYSSLKVSGDENVTIISVMPMANKLKTMAPTKEATTLNGDITRMEMRRAKEQAAFETYEDELKMLESNFQVSGNNVQLKAEDLQSVANVLRSRIKEVKLYLIESSAHLADFDDSLSRMKAQLRVLQSIKEEPSTDVTVTVKSDGGNANFTMSYVVGNAGWFPSYDLRVQELNQPLHLVYKANVYQHTGENWKNVKVIFSNGDPNERNLPPVLRTLLLRNNNVTYRSQNVNIINPNIREVHGKVIDGDGNGIPFCNILVIGSSVGTNTDENGSFSIQIPPNSSKLKFMSVGYKPQERTISEGEMLVKLEEEVTGLNEVSITTLKPQGIQRVENAVIRGSRDNTTTYYVDGVKLKGLATVEERPIISVIVNFELKELFTLMCDGKTRSIEMRTEDMPVSYEHFAIPKMEKKVYLLAHIPNWEDFNLMDGEANLYYEGTFTGKTLLTLEDAEDTLHLSLGVDKGVSIARTKVKEFNKRQLLSDNKVISTGFELVARNNKKFPLHLVVEDQVPVSGEREILVSEENIDGGEKDAESGKVTWKFDLLPAKEKKWKLQYSVKAPKNYRLQID